MVQSIRIGAGGSWPVFDETLDPRVVKQRSGVSCGPACGEMLFADRGVKIRQEAIEKASYVPIDAIDLAAVRPHGSTVRRSVGSKSHKKLVWWNVDHFKRK